MRKIVAIIILIIFSANCFVPPSCAQALALPEPGRMLSFSPAYMPVMMKGLQVHSDKPLLFDFILDPGDAQLPVDSVAFKAESQKLIKYFLASLTIKEDDLWVNLSPYEKDRIIPEELGKTELGRDMLAQDYILKQLTASMIYPEKDLGKAFWDKVYAKAQEQFGTTDIPVDTFNKVWIVADQARVLERNNAAYVTGAHLKVMLESDYIAMSVQPMPTGGHVPESPDDRQRIGTCPPAGCQPIQLMKGEASQVSTQSPNGQTSTQEIARNMIREVIIPELEKEVNEGSHFAPLRQMFYAMILSTWFKAALKNIFLNQVYGNKGKTGGVLSDDPAVKEKIYAQYLEAYAKGVFNYIKEDMGVGAPTESRKYFSGGITPGFGVLAVIDRAQTVTPADRAAIGQRNVRVELEIRAIRKASSSDFAQKPLQNNDFLQLYADVLAVFEDQTYHPEVDEQILQKFIAVSSRFRDSRRLAVRFFHNLESQFWIGRIDRVEDAIVSEGWDEAARMIDFIWLHQDRLSEDLQERLGAVAEFYWNVRLEEVEELIAAGRLDVLKEKLPVVSKAIDEYRSKLLPGSAVNARLIRVQREYEGVDYGNSLRDIVNTFRDGKRVSRRSMNEIWHNYGFLIPEHDRILIEVESLMVKGIPHPERSAAELNEIRQQLAAAQIVVNAGFTDMARKRIEAVLNRSIMSRNKEVDQMIIDLRKQCLIVDINDMRRDIEILSRQNKVSQVRIETIERKIKRIESWPMDLRPKGAVFLFRQWKDIIYEQKMRRKLGTSGPDLSLLARLSLLRGPEYVSSSIISQQRDVLKMMAANYAELLFDHIEAWEEKGILEALSLLFDLAIARTDKDSLARLQTVLDLLREENFPIGLEDKSQNDSAMKNVETPDMAQVLKNRGVSVKSLTNPQDQVVAPGGIDLDAKKMDLDVVQDGKGVETGFDPAIMAEFQQGNFMGLEGVILSIVPIQNLLPVFEPNLS